MYSCSVSVNLRLITAQLIAAACCLLIETGSVLSKQFNSAAAAKQTSSDTNPIGGPYYPNAAAATAAYSPALDYERKSTYSSPYSPYGSSVADTPFGAESPAADMSNLAATDFDDAVQRQPSPPTTKVYQSSVGRVVGGGGGPTRQESTLQASTTVVGDLNTAAGHHHGHHHGKYYEYREVPKKHTWKFGYKRGNHKHHIERHEHGKAGKKHPHFKTKVKWADKKSKGKGIHLWDYNHHDKKHYHHGK